MNATLKDIWMCEKAKPDFMKRFGDEIMAQCEDEIRPLRTLVQEYFGMSSDVVMSCRQTCEDGIPYTTPEAIIYICGFEIFHGSILECTRTLLQMVKDFIEANTSRVCNAIAEATAEPENPPVQAEEQKQGRKVYTEEQQQAMRKAGTTQGRKGCKAVRINMAFSPKIHEYIRVMARVMGESVTDFTNRVFKQSMKDNAELYEKARAFTTHGR